MRHQFIWLHNSLFCGVSRWNSLFKNGIVPFLQQDQQHDQLIVSFKIGFDYLTGANIRFSLLTRRDGAFKLAKATDRYFKNYFNDEDLEPQEMGLRGGAVFMPFPSNMIRYGLFSMPYMEKCEPEENLLANGLSNVILEALGDDLVDGEVILIFAFYLHVVAAKAINSVYNSRVDFSEEHAKVDDGFKEDFYKAGQTLTEIIAEIMEVGSQSSQLMWLDKWADICLTELFRFGTGKASPLEAYFNLSSKISEQLSLHGRPGELLKYFVAQGLNNYYAEEKV